MQEFKKKLQITLTKDSALEVALLLDALGALLEKLDKAGSTICKERLEYLISEVGVNYNAID